MNQLKFIIFDLRKKEFLDDYTFKGAGVYKMTNFGKQFYFDAENMRGFYHSLNYKKHNAAPLPNSVLNHTLTNAPYKNDGSLVANKDYIVLARYYAPSLILYDKRKKELEDFNFDETESKTDYGDRGHNKPGIIRLRMRVFTSTLKKILTSYCL